MKTNPNLASLAKHLLDRSNNGYVEVDFILSQAQALVAEMVKMATVEERHAVSAIVLGLLAECDITNSFRRRQAVREAGNKLAAAYSNAKP